MEGFISYDNLDPSFEFKDKIKFYSKKLNKSFEIGQKISVVLKNVNVSLGKIDFTLG